MRYTKEQIAVLGIRPRDRGHPKDGCCSSLLPCEEREVKAVAKDIKNSEELWQYFRIIPFEEGYACQRRREFEKWVDAEVRNMWYDIGRPVFDEEGNWSCPEGGWWPYIDGPNLGISWMRVGKAYIDMDEIYTTLRNYLEEKVGGYRMCPGMALYRVVREWCKAIKDMKPLADIRNLEAKMKELARTYPTETTKKLQDREYFPYYQYVD